MTTFVLSIAVYLVTTAIYSLPGGLLLMMFTRMVTGITLRYGKAYGISFAAGIIASVIHELMRLGTPPGVEIHPAVFFLLSCTVSIPVSGFVYGRMIEARRTHDPIGFSKGLVISLLYFAVVAIIILPILILAVGLELIGR